MLRASAQHAEYLIWELSQIFDALHHDITLDVNKFVTELRGN